MFKRAILASAAVLAVSLVAASPAQAAIPFTSSVSGTTYIAKLNDTSAVPAGTKFTGVLDGNTITGRLSTVTTVKTVTLVDVPTVGTGKATVRVVATRDSVMTINADQSASGTSYFRIEIPALYSDLFPGVNLVKPGCKTGEIAAPVSSTKVNPFGDTPLKGTFTIPAFTGCGITELGPIDPRDALLTEKISGPGNKLDLVLGPAQF